MPTPEQMSAQQASMPPEVLRSLPEQRRGANMVGGGLSVLTQHESVLAARVAELADEVRALRAMLSPPSAVILTGPRWLNTSSG